MNSPTPFSVLAWRDSILQRTIQEEPDSFVEHPSKWGLIQLLAAHPNPKSCLFLGVTVSDDMQGAARLGHTVYVADPSPQAKAIVVGKSSNPQRNPLIHVEMNPSEPQELGMRFDVVFVSLWWTAEGKRLGVSLTKLISDALAYLNPEGSLIIHHLSERPGLIPKLISRFVFKAKISTQRVKELPCWSVDKIREALPAVPIRSYRIVGKFTSPSRIVEDQIPSKSLIEFVRGLQIINRMPLVPFLVRASRWIGFPLSRVFPFGILSSNFTLEQIAGTSTEVPSEDELRIEFARVAKRSLSTCVKRADTSWYVRLDDGRGFVQKESKLLEFLDQQKTLRSFIHPPFKTESLCGMHGAWYKKLSGHTLSNKQISSIRTHAMQFLTALSAIPCPSFMNSASEILKGTLATRHHRYKSLLVPRGQAALAKLEDSGAFRFITHGDFYSGNFRVLENHSMSSFKILDWVDSFCGHPLLDWWTFLYAGCKKKESIGDTPEELRKGLGEKEVDDLWILWRAALQG